MKRLRFLIYNGIALPVMWFLFHTYSIWNKKIRNGLKDRRGLMSRLGEQLTLYDGHGPRFWIHNSSMGEFEQAKPIIKQLRKEFPRCFILVTFFSPSGYQNTKEYEYADILTYIPFDTFHNARNFIDLAKPDMAVMIKYDLWPNHLWYCFEKKVPVLLVNASVRPAVLKNRGPMKRFFLPIYNNFTSILTISKEAKDYMDGILKHSRRIQVTGDTRYDQVLNRAESAADDVHWLEAVAGNKPCLVAGSTWPGDERRLVPGIRRAFDQGIHFKVIIVPHEPTEEHVGKLELLLDEHKLTHTRFSELHESSTAEENVLIVDTVGILASLYSLADITYVGGGFSTGVHSVLEPAAFGKPVLFGPKHYNSHEAIELTANGGGVEVKTDMDIYDYFARVFADRKTLLQSGERAGILVHENRGATKRIVQHIKDCLPDHA